MINFQQCIIVVCIVLLSACGGKTIKKQNYPASGVQATSSEPQASSKGGYYLDDGPGENAPADIDSIPDAQLKTETPLARANKPYSALGQKYVPMTNYAPYVKIGMASWYGKRYHGKKTSSGEVYDMYAMSGAHTTLPIPSYVKVTNPANGRSVVVRINDRGPFKHDRLIDLSYAAAYKLRLINQGSGLVEVQTLDTSPEALRQIANTRTALATNSTVDASSPAASAPSSSEKTVTSAAPTISASKISTDAIATSYYVQAGAFKSEINGDILQKKILGLELAGNAAVANVYNNGLYRVKLGPFDTRKEADMTATKVRKQLNISAIVTNQ